MKEFNQKLKAEDADQFYSDYANNAKRLCRTLIGDLPLSMPPNSKKLVNKYFDI